MHKFGYSRTEYSLLIMDEQDKQLKDSPHEYDVQTKTIGCNKKQDETRKERDRYKNIFHCGGLHPDQGFAG